MKVLFAVNNDNVSEAIAQKYQKEYKEILSYKNVYYFNAIIRELQKDKTYNRIVISEDLEPFANNNYDMIDNFLYEKYNNISNEAKAMNDQKIDVILICADRRKKAEDIFTKLYNLDMYNAIIGADRSIDEICKLIYSPRDKNLARQYYEIPVSDLSGQEDGENSVSEAEVENILAHYKRLGKNEDKYVDSFNNIITQYTDTQLKIIIRYLPINVKAVLEAKSPKYQQLVTSAGFSNQNLSFNMKAKKVKQKSSQPKKSFFGKSKNNNVVEEKKEEPILDTQNPQPKPSDDIVIPSNISTENVQKLNNPAPQIENTSDIFANENNNMNNIDPMGIQQPEEQLNNNDIFAPTPVTEPEPEVEPQAPDNDPFSTAPAAPVVPDVQPPVIEEPDLFGITPVEPSTESDDMFGTLASEPVNPVTPAPMQEPDLFGMEQTAESTPVAPETVATEPDLFAMNETVEPTPVAPDNDPFSTAPATPVVPEPAATTEPDLFAMEQPVAPVTEEPDLFAMNETVEPTPVAPDNDPFSTAPATPAVPEPVATTEPDLFAMNETVEQTPVAPDNDPFSTAPATPVVPEPVATTEPDLFAMEQPVAPVTEEPDLFAMNETVEPTPVAPDSDPFSTAPATPVVPEPVATTEPDLFAMNETVEPTPVAPDNDPFSTAPATPVVPEPIATTEPDLFAINETVEPTPVAPDNDPFSTAPATPVVPEPVTTTEPDLFAMEQSVAPVTEEPDLFAMNETVETTPVEPVNNDDIFGTTPVAPTPIEQTTPTVPAEPDLFAMNQSVESIEEDDIFGSEPVIPEAIDDGDPFATEPTMEPVNNMFDGLPQTANIEGQNPEGAPVKRGRGRPRTRPEVDPNAPKRGRGRPRTRPEVDPNAPKRGRGRPRKEVPVQEIPEQNVQQQGIQPGFQPMNQDGMQQGMSQPVMPQNQGQGWPMPEPIQTQQTDISNLEPVAQQQPVYPQPEPMQQQTNMYVNPMPVQPNAMQPDFNTMQLQQNADTFNMMNNNVDDLNRESSYSNLNALLTSDKKIAAFVGTTKNGTSFVVNNTAEMLSSMGVQTAILDMTKTKNAYYIYTNNEERLRQTAAKCMHGLEAGIAEGIRINKYLTVFTEMPGEEDEYDIEKVLSTLVQNYSAVLIDTDFDTTYEIFEKAQEIYLVQTMDILTIQPLTAFLRNLKSKNILQQEKIKIVINKSQRMKSLSSKILIGGMSCYNAPDMSYMTELFDRDKVKYCELPFDPVNYTKYLESLVECSITLNGYTKSLMSALRTLANMVYPIGSKPSFSPLGGNNNNNNAQRDPFSAQTSNTLDKMKNSGF